MALPARWCSPYEVLTGNGTAVRRESGARERVLAEPGGIRIDGEGVLLKRPTRFNLTYPTRTIVYRRQRTSEWRDT